MTGCTSKRRSASCTTAGTAAAASAMILTQRKATGLPRKPIRVSVAVSRADQAARPAPWKATSGAAAEAFASGAGFGARKICKTICLLLETVGIRRPAARPGRGGATASGEPENPREASLRAGAHARRWLVKPGNLGECRRRDADSRASTAAIKAPAPAGSGSPPPARSAAR